MKLLKRLKAAYWRLTVKEIARRVCLPYIAIVFGVIITLPSMEWLGSVARIAGVPALLAWAGAVVITGRIRQLNVLHLVTLLFIAWCLASFYWSSDSEATLDKTYRIALPLGLSIIMWDLYRTQKQVYGVLQWVVYGGWFIALSVMGNYLQGTTALSQRFSAIGVHPNDVARLLGIAMPMAWVLAMDKTTKIYHRVGNYIFPVVSTVAILLSASRGGLLSAIPAYLFMLWSLRKASLPIKFGVLVMCSAAGAWVAKSFDFSAQIQRLQESGDLADANGRLEIWKKGLDLISKHPMAGVGYGGFPGATGDSALQRNVDNSPLVAHNTYLSVLTETGVVGFIIFFIIMVVVLVNIRKIKTNMRGAMFAAFMVWAIGCAASVWDEHGQTWLLFSLSMIAGNMVVPEELVTKVTRLRKSRAEVVVSPGLPSPGPA